MASSAEEFTFASADGKRSVLLRRASSVPVTEIACYHNKVLATWHADTDEWTYQHRVGRKRPTQKQSEQLAQMFDQASAATQRACLRL